MLDQVEGTDKVIACRLLLGEECKDIGLNDLDAALCRPFDLTAVGINPKSVDPLTLHQRKPLPPATAKIEGFEVASCAEQQANVGKIGLQPGTDIFRGTAEPVFKTGIEQIEELAEDLIVIGLPWPFCCLTR